MIRDVARECISVSAVAPGFWSRRDGFTLIEAVAIMAVTGLLMAVVLPALPTAVSKPQIEGLALAVAAVLTADHQTAMRRQIEVASVVDTAARVVRSGAGGRSIALPDGIAITATLARTCVGAPVSNRIVFLSDGTSCGGAVTLARAGQAVDVRVNWLTGATEIASRSRN